MNNTIKEEALKSFFGLFDAQILIKTRETENNIIGTLNWIDEEDIQDFKWYNIFNDETLIILKEICDFIKSNGLNDNDKIIITEKDLRNKLKASSWTNNEIEKGIDSIMSISVKMVDEGEETDSFFLHF
jgi:hypothetical protein